MYVLPRKSSSQNPQPQPGVRNAARPQRITWRSRSRDQSIRHTLLPTGDLLEPNLYLQPFSRYSTPTFVNDIHAPQTRRIAIPPEGGNKTNNRLRNELRIWPTSYVAYLVAISRVAAVVPGYVDNLQRRCLAFRRLFAESVVRHQLSTITRHFRSSPTADLHKYNFSDRALRLCSLPSIFFKSQHYGTEDWRT